MADCFRRPAQPYSLLDAIIKPAVMASPLGLPRPVGPGFLFTASVVTVRARLGVGQT